MFKNEPEAVFHIGSPRQQYQAREQNGSVYKTTTKSIIVVQTSSNFSYPGVRDMIKQLFHSISSYKNYSQLGTAHLVAYMHWLMYDSISWNNCFIQTERQKLSGKAKVMKLSQSSRVSIIL